MSACSDVRQQNGLPPSRRERPLAEAARTGRRLTVTLAGAVVRSARTKELTQMFLIGTYVRWAKTAFDNLAHFSSKTSLNESNFKNEFSEACLSEKVTIKLLFLSIFSIGSAPLKIRESLFHVNERSIRFAYIKGSLASTKAEWGSLHRPPRWQTMPAYPGSSGRSAGALKAL